MKMKAKSIFQFSCLFFCHLVLDLNKRNFKCRFKKWLRYSRISVGWNPCCKKYLLLMHVLCYSYMQTLIFLSRIFEECFDYYSVKSTNSPVQDSLSKYLWKCNKEFFKKSLKVFRLKAAILGLWFVNVVMSNCSLLFKTCLNVYSPTSPAQWCPVAPSATQPHPVVPSSPTSTTD